MFSALIRRVGLAPAVQCSRLDLVETLKLDYPHLPHHSTYRRILGEVVDGEELAWQTRRTASFAFTPRWCGYEQAGPGGTGCYRPTAAYAAHALVNAPG